MVIEVLQMLLSRLVTLCPTGENVSSAKDTMLALAFLPTNVSQLASTSQALYVALNGMFASREILTYRLRSAILLNLKSWDQALHLHPEFTLEEPVVTAVQFFYIDNARVCMKGMEEGRRDELMSLTIFCCEFCTAHMCHIISLIAFDIIDELCLHPALLVKSAKE